MSGFKVAGMKRPRFHARRTFANRPHPSLPYFTRGSAGRPPIGEFGCGDWRQPQRSRRGDRSCRATTNRSCALWREGNARHVTMPQRS